MTTTLQTTQLLRHAPAIPEALIEARPSAPKRLALTMDVRDDFVRQQVQGFDGLERPFALLPEDAAGSLWKKVELSYQSTARSPAISSPIDRYQLVLNPGDFSPSAVAAHGIAWGLDTNVGTLWLQAPGQNSKPSPGVIS